MYININNLNLDIENKTIYHDINIDINKGEFIGIIGPNGSGKSTLLKTMYNILKPTTGSIFISSNNLKEMTPKETAREISVVSQENNSNFDFTVKDIVLMGTYAQKTLFESSTKEDNALVSKILDFVGMKGFEKRSFLNLSGGEKQRVFIARGIIQNTEILILDEPTNHLDIGAQIKTLDLIKSMDKTIITALHDLNIASKYCDRIYVMKSGQIISSGKPCDILNENLVKELYGIDTNIISINGKKYINYI